MKKLLLTLGLSTFLLSTAQAQEIQSEQDLLNAMMGQMTGQLSSGQADLREDSFLLREYASTTERGQESRFESDRLGGAGFESNRYREPMSRPLR